MTASLDPLALREARVAAGLTQQQLDSEVGLAGGDAVARWERGATQPRPATLRRLATVLEVAPADLLARDQGEVDLRFLRLAATLDSATVAKRLHVTVNTYLRWERGAWTVLPDETTTAALAEILNTTPTRVAGALAHSRALARIRA